MMKLLTETEMKEAQKRLDEINSSGNYSFIRTIDERGCIHITCDAETFIKEMTANGDYVTYEDLKNNLDNFINNHTNYTG